MPRARCHWALLVRTRDALKDVLPEAHALASEHRADFLAGGLAPDALRLFAGRDKLSSHFYDDQRQETWDRVVDAMRQAQPAVADPARLPAPAQAWLAGYLTHVLTDVAYWRHVISKLPPFPAHTGVHHGAWLLADDLTIPAAERALDLEAVRYEAAPPWVEAAAVRQMLGRVTGRILAPDGMWAVELAYARSRPDLRDRADEDVLAERLPEWEANLAEARAALPAGVWAAFQEAAVAGSVQAIAAYLNR